MMWRVYCPNLQGKKLNQAKSKIWLQPFFVLLVLCMMYSSALNNWLTFTGQHSVKHHKIGLFSHHCETVRSTQSALGHINVITQILEKCDVQQEDISFIFSDMGMYSENCCNKPLERHIFTNQSYRLLEICIAMTDADYKYLLNEFYNTKGLLQRCLISLILFKLYIYTSNGRFV
jgi:hypothetical protein